MTKINVIVLAAGKGTRMYSEIPKVLHKLAGKSLLQHALDAATAVNSSATHVVIGHGSELVEDTLSGQAIDIVMQHEQLGTAHAVHQALPKLDEGAIALVLYGDVPLITPETLLSLLGLVNEQTMAVLTCIVANPTGLGRIIRNSDDKITAIVEEKDASAAERLITEINTGIMAIPVTRLHDWLPRISTNNAQGEYYLTDIVALAIADGCSVATANCVDELEAAGVNNRVQLAELERHYQKREAVKLMASGVTLRDPERFDIRGELAVGKDVEIDINVIIEGKVSLGNNVKIGANCIIRNSSIGSGTTIEANSIIEDSIVGDSCTVGPYARLRPGAHLEAKAKIGNFVEIKKSHIGVGSKVNHLSYIGDSVLGTGVNIGAGTITCNYDGVNKFKTIIKDDVFIGSNTALVAPVTVGAGATVAAGSVITKDIEENHLALARSKQLNKSGWKRPVKLSK